MRNRRHRKLLRGIAYLLVALAIWAAQRFDLQLPGRGSAATADEAAILEAFDQHTSNLEVEVMGVVRRLLADDTAGSRHQRFIVELASGHTVLVAHNIDLAERVPLARGDQVEIGGEYEWSERGGVIHWTHHDPRGRHRGGYIRHGGSEYR